MIGDPFVQVFGFLVLLVIGGAVYCLPTIVSGARHRLIAPVLVINIFLGWTLLGWVLALAMAVTERSEKEEAQRLAEIEANRERNAWKGRPKPPRPA